MTGQVRIENGGRKIERERGKRNIKKINNHYKRSCTAPLTKFISSCITDWSH